LKKAKSLELADLMTIAALEVAVARQIGMGKQLEEDVKWQQAMG